MKQVLIVDDERPARELLKMSLNWEELGFEPPIEANNGAQALEKYQSIRPEFVITDIQMPVMDGLELIRRIRKIHQDQHIIILSCHESFAFAKQAIRLGVVDYLIKDELDPRALAEILLTPMDTAEKPSEPKKMVQILEPLFTKQMSKERAGQILDACILQGQEYIVCHINGTTVFSSRLQRIGEFVCKHNGDLCRTPSGDLALLLLCPTHVSRMADIHEKNRLLMELRRVLEEGGLGPYTIGVSNSSRKGAELESCLRQARIAAGCSVFYGTGRTIYYDEQHSCMRESSLDQVNERLARIIQAMDHADAETIRLEMTYLYRRDLPGMLQINYLQHINILLLTMLTSRCIQKKIPFELVFGTKTLSALPEECETAEQMLQWYLSRFDGYFRELSRRTEYQISPKIEKITAYIEHNWNQDLSLELVAEQFAMHKVYLAKIFKKEVGCSVNEYIRTTKTSKAKQLLEQRSLKINTISQMLGFNNTQTFYNVFKGCVGLSPSEYREQLDKNLQYTRQKE